MPTVAMVPHAPPEAPAADKSNMAEQMKQIKKAKLEREAMVDPSKLGKLIKAETTLLYNASAEIVQSTGSL